MPKKPNAYFDSGHVQALECLDPRVGMGELRHCSHFSHSAQGQKPLAEGQRATIALPKLNYIDLSGVMHRRRQTG